MAIVQPVIRLILKGGVCRNPHRIAAPGFLFVLQNDLIRDWKITPETGGSVFVRRVLHKRPLWDDKLFTYLNEPVDEIAVKEQIDNFDKGTPLKMRMSMSVHFHEFSKRLMDYLTRDKDDEFNLADPEVDPARSIDDKRAIVGDGKTPKSGTFWPDSTKRGLQFSFRNASQSIEDIPCVLSAYKTDPQRPSLTFNLDMSSIDSVKRLDFMRVLMAADHTQLLTFGSLDATGETKKRLEIWARNVNQFLINFVDFSRGRKIFEGIANRAKTKFKLFTTNRDFVVAVRDDVDRKLIAANHWTEARENEPGEEYQQRMSMLIGSVKDSKGFASPVNSLRAIRETIESDMLAKKKPPTPLTAREFLDVLADSVVFTLQFGVGHCQEHANVAYVVLVNLMESDTDIRDKLKTVILGGNANIDHEFVVGGLRPDRTELAEVRRDDNFRQKRGGAILVYDLARLLATPLPGDGFVCDAYISRKLVDTNLDRMLKRINDPSRKDRATKYLALDHIHPETPEVPDIAAPSAPVPHPITGI